MPTNKWFLKSKTIWGIIVAALPAIVEVAGLGTIEDLPVINEAVLNLIDNVNEIVGGVLILWARYQDGGTMADRLTVRRS